MRWNDLSRVSKMYIAAVVASATIFAFFASFTHFFLHPYHRLIIFFILGCLAARIIIRFPFLDTHFSMDTAFVFSILMTFGIFPAVVAEFFTKMVFSTHRLTKATVYKTPLNIGIGILSICSAGIAYQYCLSAIDPLVIAYIPAVLSMVLAYYLVHSVAHSIFLSLTTEKNIYQTWWQFRWTVFNFAACGSVATLLFSTDKHTEAVAIVMSLPVVVLGILKDSFYEKHAVEQIELRRSEEIISLLRNVGQAMNFISDLKKLLRYILQQAIDTADAEKGSLMLFDPDTGKLHLRVMEGLDDPELQEKINNNDIPTQSFSLGEGVAGKVLQTGKPLFSNDLGRDDQFVRGEKSHARSIACIPMTVFDNVIGVINLTNKRGDRGFSEEDIRLLQTVADHAAMAINKAQLWEMAVTDSLTGLYVRRFFKVKLEEELRRAIRYKHNFSIMMIDIDRFKDVNDTYGHPQGDRILEKIAMLLKKYTRDTDLIARYGGEEFVVYLPETSSYEALGVAERIREGIERHSFENAFPLTVSVGLASFPKHCNQIDGLIKKADSALYHAKETGRNRVAVFNKDIPIRMMDHQFDHADSGILRSLNEKLNAEESSLLLPKEKEATL